ncbi:ceramide glucosyltransferase [Cupriavidus gilardii J11]|uniref:Ceramide glucosyltransferase n=1 Tax=Cupriavidus gilardii J11 TaxID=936133 RepID=A0A562B943_9BURK|nr:ceramide glucosyltransferase [Cupriavidus gilardii J11]
MNWASVAGSALTVATSGYAVAALWASWRAGRGEDLGGGVCDAGIAFSPGPSPASGRGAGERAVNDIVPVPGVSVLKPLCGDEPRLYANLATFCRQTHPRFQLVFGVREADDPAIAVAERLREEFPDRDIALVVDTRMHGGNPKVSNLINMLGAAAYDRLVIADSDVAVPRDWLDRVAAPLEDHGVGIVTCLYRARPVGGAWARVGAQFVDEWFVPAVRIAQAASASASARPSPSGATRWRRSAASRRWWIAWPTTIGSAR